MGDICLVSEAIDNLKKLVKEIYSRSAPANASTTHNDSDLSKEIEPMPPILPVPSFPNEEPANSSDDHIKQLEELRAEISMTQQINKELKASLASSEENNTSLREQIRSIERLGKSQEAQLNKEQETVSQSLKSEVESLRQEIATLFQYKDSCDASAQSLKSLLTSFSQQFVTFEEHRQKLQSDNADCRQALSLSQEKVQRAEATLTSAKEEIANLQKQIQQAESIHQTREEIFQANERSREELAQRLEEEVRLHQEAKSLLSQPGLVEKCVPLEDGRSDDKIPQLLKRQQEEQEKIRFKLKCAEQMLHEERKSVVDLKLEAKRKADASLAVIGNLKKQVQRLERNEKELLEEVRTLRAKHQKQTLRPPASRDQPASLGRKRPLRRDPDEIEEPVDDDSLALDFGDLYYGNQKPCSQCSQPVLLDSLSSNKPVLCRRCQSQAPKRRRH